ncbi:DUF6600 domain-containing protein [Cupriavidus sp. AcVe19-6a]|uniref:DUF6600 domain-containing protein n=1 Tax=Cupriavidus sp. AcVe19-6a TaxID=2821358 RepID=UPI001AEAFAD3|nr:DUF6600 domain-containing protein [Cupriavidus sp. AcVe19-6a]MBP0634633.1 branched-chain amino acid ABC transporter substrate-binding protein [Cupriavidus sp. AcVe19-6a]
MSESVQPGGTRSLAGPRRLALTALAAAAALAVAAAALAQVPAPDQPYLDAPMADAPVAQADPSARIATLTAVEGNLSFAPAGSDQWAATGLNRPVTTGDRLWMDAGGRAELHAGTVAMRMGGATAASILNLDDDTTQVKLTQGTLQVRVRALPQDQTVEIDTPNLAFVPREPGDYRLDVAPDGSTTTVTMRHGSAVVYGDSRSIELQRGDRMRFAGTDLADAGGGPVAEDSFDRWTAARDAREDASPSARYLPREMPGYAALDDYGDWQEEPAYGAVWFPRVVSVGWAPYSVGHWAWIAPWGWTWIDDAPWGFAPSHYGRWAYVGTRWGWVPGPRVRPCYAPAVVAFVGGGGPSWSSVRVGGGPGVAWYPLAPRDAYRPAYRASPSYVARINRVTVNNFVMGDRGRPAPYANRNVPGAITGMPARNFVEGRPVRGMHRAEWRNLPAGEARGGPPVAPVKNSLVGAAPVRQLPPQARPGFERQAIAAHPPGRPATDDLARRFAREGGVVPGAGPVWRGSSEPRPGRPGRPGREVQPMPDVRMSQAALAAREQQPRGGRPDPAQGPDGWRGNGRGQGSRPDDGRGFAGQPDAQRQAQAMQREQQQAREQQRQQQEAMERRQQEQQRQWQGQPGREQQQARELQRQQQEAMERRQQEQQRAQQRQWADGQDRPDPARQSQDMQRQRFEQQRQMQEAQQRQAQDAQQRQMQEGRQRQAHEAQRQQMEQQRQAQDAQRQQMEQQRQAHDAQRQQMDQQRQAGEQQRQQVERQRQMAEQQRQGQEMQRQRFEQQRQMQEAQQRQAQEAQQRQAQAAQRQQMEQQRQMQEQHRQVQEQQRQMQEQQRQQAMQRQQAEQQQRAAQAQQRAMQEQQRHQQEQQRAMQEQQRHQQEQQRQMQDRQRQQQEQQRQQQQRAQHDRGQMEAHNRDGDRRQ